MLPRLRTLISGVLVACGSYLLFLGAREFLESRFGQNEAERDFEISEPGTAPASSLTAPTAPRRGEAIARLIIPRLDTNLYVIEGDGDKELRRGPGHLTGTALPGARGNCVIAGHRDTHFRVLKDIRRGDDIILETRSGQFLYRVQSTMVVSPKNTASLQPTPDAELNLITCYPFYYVGAAPKRFVVEAQFVDQEKPEATPTAFNPPPVRPTPASTVSYRARPAISRARRASAFAAPIRRRWAR
jgi:sortase A